MPYCIRHKATGQIMKMRSGKSVWAQQGHAKAAYKTSGCYMKVDGFQKLFGGWRGETFDKQDIFEIVEAKLVTDPKVDKNPIARLEKAEFLLDQASVVLYAVGTAGSIVMYGEIRQFLEGK